MTCSPGLFPVLKLEYGTDLPATTRPSHPVARRYLATPSQGAPPGTASVPRTRAKQTVYSSYPQHPVREAHIPHWERTRLFIAKNRAVDVGPAVAVVVFPGRPCCQHEMGKFLTGMCAADDVDAMGNVYIVSKEVMILCDCRRI